MTCSRRRARWFPVRKPSAPRISNWEFARIAPPTTRRSSSTEHDSRTACSRSRRLCPGARQLKRSSRTWAAVKAYGAEFSGQWKPNLLGGRVYFNANLAHNTAKFEDSYSTLAIKGNTLPDFPEWLAQAGVTVEAASFLVFNVSARYIGERQTNFTNAGAHRGLLGRQCLRGHRRWLHGGAVQISQGTPERRQPVRSGLSRHDHDDDQHARHLRPGPPRTVQVTVSAEF